MIKKFEDFINENQELDMFPDEFLIFDDTFKNFDLSKIPVDKLKKQFVNFKFKLVGTPYGSELVESTKQRRLTEGITHSVDVGDVKDEMIKKYGLDSWQFDIAEMENDIKVAIIIPHVDENESMVVEDMVSMGYYLSFRNDLTQSGMNYILLRFDPRYPKSVTNDVRNMEFIYHWSPKYNLELIKKLGFTPQSKNKRFSYPPRIHFIKSDVLQSQIESLGKQLCESNDDVRNDGEYVLFTLDVSKIPDNVNFIGDSCYKHGICTEDEIPYECVVGVNVRKFI